MNPFINILVGIAELAERYGENNIAIVLYCLLGTISLGNTHELARICKQFSRGELGRMNN